MPDKEELSEFMLKEYEHLAAAYFNSHDITAKWVKYYLVILATPFSLIAFIYKDKPQDFNLFVLPITLSILICLVGFIGLLISFIILNTRLDTTLYARAVNGVRRYFWDRAREKKIAINESLYRVLPDDVKVPKFIKMSDLTWLIIMMIAANSFYLSISIPQILAHYSALDKYIPKMFQFAFWVIVVTVVHIVYYYKMASKKENTYPNLVTTEEIK